MKITAKAKTGSAKIDFPWIPDKISFKSGGIELATYDIQDFGKLARPSGISLITVEWERRFPGKARIGHPFLAGAWKKPDSYLSILNKWRLDRVLLKLTVSGTPIAMYCYLDNYEAEYKEGFGDCLYKVSFTEYRSIQVKTKAKKKKQSGQPGSRTSSAGAKRPVSGRSTYQVRTGDDLFKIAKKNLGSGSRWKEIYELNKAAIEQAAKKHGKKSSANGYWIYAGTKLKLPKKQEGFMDYTRPEYAVTIVTPDKTRYYVKKMGQAAGLVTGLELSEPDRQLAQKAVIKLADIKIPGAKGGYPNSLFQVRSRVFIHAKGAGKTKGEEVFRGFIWETRYSRSAKRELELTCYDNLIYLMNSEVRMFFFKGKSTKAVVSSICGKWGIKHNYTYASITHPKLPLSGMLADVLTSDVLDTVKKKKGTDYIIRSVRDVMEIAAVGKNRTVYRIDRAGRGVQMDFAKTVSMDDMVTKMVIAGKTDKKGKTKIEAALKKNTKEYGTLQKVIHKDEDMKLKEAKAEAETILKDHAKPDVQFDVSALEIPWVHKGEV